MDLWSRVRAANNEPPKTFVKPASGVRALFKLEVSSDERRNEVHRVLQDSLAHVGWEVCYGQSLPVLPDTLHAPVDEYDLVIVFVPSLEVWHRHTTHLRTLSPDFPFLIVLDGVAQSSAFKSQCPILSSDAGNADVVLPALLSLCDASIAGGTCTARAIAENRQYGALSLTQRQSSALDVPWCGNDVRADVSFSLTLSVDADEDVDGRYVGGLLKHILPSARIRLSEKRGLIAVRAPDVNGTFELQSLLSSTGLSMQRFAQPQPGGTFMTDPLDVDVVALCRDVRKNTSLSKRVHSCFPSYRLEVTSGLSAYLSLSMLLDRSTIDNEICCRVEQISTATFAGNATKVPVASTASVRVGSSVEQHQPWGPSTPRTAAVAIAPAETGEYSSPTKVLGRPPLPVIAPQQSQPTTARSQLPAARSPPQTSFPPPAPDMDAIERLIHQKITAAISAQDESNDQWRSLMEQRISDMEHRSLASEERCTAIEGNLSSLHAFFEQRFIQVESVAQSNDAQLKALAGQLELVRESAADHRLVESALNEVRNRSATLQGVKEAEERVATVAQSIQRANEHSRLSIEALKGHMEALSIQHNQLAHRLEAHHPGAELQQVLEDSLRRLDGRLSAVESGHQRTENDASVFHKAFEVGLNRLFEQLRLFHDDLSNLDGQVNSQTSRIDGMQNRQASLESTITRVVDEALTNGSAQRMEAIHDQLTSVKAYCVAAVERSSEMQSERVSDIEKKLAKDMQRAMDLLHSQHQSEVQRVQNSVEGHIKAQKQLMDELQMMSPARLAGSPRKEDVTLLRDQLDHVNSEYDRLRERVKSIELLQADVSSFIGDEEKRRGEMDEVNLRLEELEASIQFIEARL
jgi:hypothetical protein